MKDFEEIAKEQVQKTQEPQDGKTAEGANATTSKPAPQKSNAVKPSTIFMILGVLFFIFVISSLGSCVNADDNDPVATLSPAELEEKENSYVRTVAQETIKKILKTPKSADFPYIDEWEFDMGDVSFYKIAHAYVDYENVFGTEVRSYFDVTVRITEEGYQTVRIVFDGEMVYEDILTIAADVADDQYSEVPETGGE